MRDNTYQSTLDISNTSKIEKLISEKRFDEALNLIEKDEDLYLKAVVLDKLGRYEESLECYNKLKPSDEVNTNKAKALYAYAKVSFFPDCEYEKALNLISQAINALPESEDSSEYYFLKAEILEALGDMSEAYRAYLIAHKEFEKLTEFEKQSEYLSTTHDLLINIAGEHFYDFTVSKGLIVDLIKEEDNEHDSDAIAVYYDGKKVAYVANSDYTLMKGLNSASDIKNKINNNSKCEILFVYLDEYVVGKVII